MRISKLDLFGFKSFPDRTSLQFGRGISCVVGPNGSGKSNVVDALKWVIGEQSARSLRGAEMSDVIFAGSTERKPVGFAEVSLTLDVDGGEPFPGEYANLQEIQVGRRLHRSGTSEYLINQVRCRRKDVVDLFLDTGIGTNLYSFIEQGRVDKVVSATPHERRGLIDEAAGISRYKARREEARARLEATVQQLDRAADVADEMGRRLKVLERQVVKAARFRRARARVRQREIFLSLVKYRGLAGDRRELQRGLREARSEEAAARRGLMRREEDLRVRREELATVDEAARTWRDELAEVDARLRELTSQQTLQGQRAKEATDQAASAARELEQVESERREAEQGLGDTRTALAETESLLAREGASSRDREEQRAVSAAQVERASERRRAAEARWQGLQAERARLQAEEAAVAERRESLPGVVVKLEARELELQEEARGLQADEEEAASLVASARDAEVAAQAALAGAEDALGQVDAEREARQAAYEGARRGATEALSQARSRLDAHRAEQRRLRVERERAREQAAQAARRIRDQEVASARQRADRWVDGVIGEARRREDEARRTLESETERWRRLASEAQTDAQRDAEAEAARRLQVAEERVRQGLAPREQAVRRGRDLLVTARDEAEQGRLALSEAEARLAALRARLAATERPAALARALPLVDRLSPEEAERALAGWGRRATLPAADEAEVLSRLVAGLEEGQSAELWWYRGREAPDVPLVDSLAEALALHAQTSAAARFPGGRVEADGVVSVGLHDAAAERVAVRREVEELEASTSDLSDALDRARQAVSAAEQALEDAETQLVDARREGDRALAAARSSTLEQTRELVREALDALEAERDAELEALRDDVTRRRQEGADAVEAVRSQREVVLDAVLREVDEELEARLAALPAVEADDEAGERALLDAVAAAEEEASRWSAPPELPPRDEAVAEVSRRRSAHQERVQSRLGAEAAVARVRQRVEELASRAEELSERLAETRAEAARWDARQEEVARAQAEVTETLTTAEGERLEAVEGHEREVARHQELVVATQSADAARQALLERQRAQASRVGELQGRLSALDERREAVQARLDDAIRRGDEASRAVEGAEEEQAVQAERRAEVFDRLEREWARRTELQEGIRDAEGDLEGLRKRLESATRATQELVDRSGGVRAEIEALRERMDDRYQVGIPGMLDRIERSGRVSLEASEEVTEGLTVGNVEVPGVEPFELRRASLDDEDAVRTAVEELEEDRRQLAGLGEVHLGAVEEYTELAERHSDLETQRADLEASVGQLRAAIAKMNRTCRERFREAFDQVNENFQLSYPKLLGGGSARLALTDDEDLLETGVEIFVQPPGKRLQHLQLLSGGEKAMTAIALLIALFRVKPSPFCVLDEVDAPLDERNGGRFNTMLRELAETSQFVVITHNRKTMECADTLYGISMTRPGVSRLVTVSLADA